MVNSMTYTKEFAEFNELNDTNIHELFHYLEGFATNYLRTPALSKASFLKQAKKLEMLSGEALPKLGYSCTAYSIFLYSHLYKKGKVRR